MTARNRVVREPYATWCGRTPVEIIHGLLPDSGFRISRIALGLQDFCLKAKVSKLSILKSSWKPPYRI